MFRTIVDPMTPWNLDVFEKLERGRYIAMGGTPSKPGLLTLAMAEQLDRVLVQRGKVPCSRPRFSDTSRGVAA